MYCDCPALTRCCFCFPLRPSIIVTACLGIILNGFRLSIVCTHVHNDVISVDLAAFRITHGLCGIACNIILIYGAHKKLINYVKIYYFYAIVSFTISIMTFIIWVAIFPRILSYKVNLCVIITSNLMSLYLILLVSSLLKKFEMADYTFSCENQVHKYPHEEDAIDSNVDHKDNTVPSYEEV